jgi:hypothetical protein
MAQKHNLSERDLRLELDGFRERTPNLEYDDLFLLWFFRAYITENEEEAVKSVTGPHRRSSQDRVRGTRKV